MIEHTDVVELLRFLKEQRLSGIKLQEDGHTLLLYNVCFDETVVFRVIANSGWASITITDPGNDKSYYFNVYRHGHDVKEPGREMSKSSPILYQLLEAMIAKSQEHRAKQLEEQKKREERARQEATDAQLSATNTLMGLSS